MKKITFLLLAAGTTLMSKAQVLLNENFTSPFNPTASNWIVQNNSAPQGTVSWTQGNQTGNNATIPAFNGAANDFYMADFLSIPNGQAGGISAWLITPPLTIYDGAQLQFATRTFSNATVFPDRLQVRMSQTGATPIPTGTTSVGSFTDLLLDINPNLTTGTSSVVSNGTVNGYPQAWTIYTLTVSGVTGTVTGRFAFRYFVENAGSAGLNSRLVGLDAVRYTLPCGPSVQQSFTVCAGVSTTLTALGGLSTTTYSWSSGGTGSTEVVSPASTTVYSLFPSVGGSVSCGTAPTATVTVGSQLSVSVSASSQTVCAGTTVTLTAHAAASTYSWAHGPTGPVITVTPNATTTYTAGGLVPIASPPFACAGLNSITITAIPLPTVVATSASTLLCSSGASTTVSFTGTGASTYIWVVGNSAAQGNTVGLNILAQTSSVTTTQTLGLIGIASTGCIGTDIFTLTISRQPTVGVTSNKAVVCLKQTATLTATGADTYTWSASTATGGVISYSNATAGNNNITVTGYNADGCPSTAAVSVSVSACAGIETLDDNTLYGKVYPNPFVNELHVSDINGTVEVYSATGQLVIRSEVSGSGTMNTADLAKGVYVVKAYNVDGELVKTTKLVKN